MIDHTDFRYNDYPDEGHGIFGCWTVATLATAGVAGLIIWLLLPQVRPLIAAAVVLYAVTLWRATRG